MTIDEIIDAFKRCIQQCGICHGVGKLPMMGVGGQTLPPSYCPGCGPASQAIDSLRTEGITIAGKRHFGLTPKTGYFDTKTLGR